MFLLFLRVPLRRYFAGSFYFPYQTSIFQWLPQSKYFRNLCTGEPFLRKINSTWLALFKFLSTFLLLLSLDRKMTHLFTGGLFTCNLITAILCKFRILVPCLSVAIKVFQIQSSFSSFIAKSLYFYKSRKLCTYIKGNTASHDIWWSWLGAEVPQTVLAGAVHNSTRSTQRTCCMSRISELFFLNCHFHMFI